MVPSVANQPRSERSGIMMVLSSATDGPARGHNPQWLALRPGGAPSLPDDREPQSTQAEYQDSGPGDWLSEQPCPAQAAASAAALHKAGTPQDLESDVQAAGGLGQSPSRSRWDDHSLISDVRSRALLIQALRLRS